ncbi:hypothetical protein ES703_61667 [subsurface metagenome]
MHLLILKRIKKILKPLAKIVSKVAVWIILFINFSLLHSKKNHVPVLLASLCFNDLLVFKINPELLKYHVSDPDSMLGNLFVWSGEWDKDIIPIEEHEKFIMIRELFVDKKDYRNTQFYSFAVSKMLNGKPVKRSNITLDSTENIISYFKKHSKLYNNIKNNGFDLELAPQVGVVMGSDGRLIHFRQGHHTLAIAKILGIENVIVRIRAVHSLWLYNQIRNKGGLYLLESVRRGFKKLLE